jgi:hypothetical protein
MQAQTIEAKLEELLDHHSGALLSLYTAFGIAQPPSSVEDLLIAFYKHGDPFATKLQELLAFESFTGDEDWLNIFNAGLSILTTGVTVAGAFSNNNHSSTTTPPPKILGMPQSLFIGMSVVLGLLVIFIIINAIKK